MMIALEYYFVLARTQRATRKKPLTGSEIDELLDLPLSEDQVNALLDEDVPPGSEDDCLESEEKKSTYDGFDRLQKVRPMIEKLNVTFSSLAAPEVCQVVDGQMISFEGRQPLKVYMAKEPKKWGYKVWVRAGQSGYVHEIEFHGDSL
ncbi:hypothetical protein HPB50_017075 [Hyalomma asiaticum]|uniref:Uncharacterized protein n=1 Tax=Hyalomma asiaticum TaxID=266040 RepID=A0ACB7RVA9_HYAAI|nr:hypothetical protein HPB50_017075 [Hyalomma asiaticum]